MGLDVCKVKLIQTMGKLILLVILLFVFQPLYANYMRQREVGWILTTFAEISKRMFNSGNDQLEIFFVVVIGMKGMAEDGKH